MNNQNKRTAILSGQQPKSRQEIIDDIIKVLADNNLSIIDAKDILNQTSKVICRQVVKSFV